MEPVTNNKIMKNKPVCDCHGVEMWWAQSKNRSGYWRCRVRKREVDNKYNKSIKSYLRYRKMELKKLKEKTLLELEELRKRRKKLERRIKYR